MIDPSHFRATMFLLLLTSLLMPAAVLRPSSHVDVNGGAPDFAAPRYRQASKARDPERLRLCGRFSGLSRSPDQIRNVPRERLGILLEFGSRAPLQNCILADCTSDFARRSIPMTINIECVLQCGNHLGEGPVWDVEEGCLYWVDGTGRRVGNPVDLAARPAHRQDQSLVARSRRRRARAAARRRRGPGARRRLLLLRFHQRPARSHPEGRRRAAAHAAERRQVRSPGTLLRRRHGRQGGAEDLRAVAPRSGSPRHEGGRGDHLHERAVLEPGRSHVLPRRYVSG